MRWQGNDKCIARNKTVTKLQRLTRLDTSTSREPDTTENSEMQNEKQTK